ncbi:MAG: glucose-1-phosphate adenylyltransferase subunit GlgD [Ruminococcaceae bacterium]|nr:glucose-1-phosphate adenylyltransferase subunit GlgD [Oscillospiraceae bacterium]
MSASGIIFSNIHDHNIPELTRLRTVASVPFACRYRFIDFTLSNMVNSNIFNISVITQYNYHSLMDHIGSGKDWDLARRSGGIKILPPFITAYANSMPSMYQTRLEALKSVNYSLSRLTDEYVVLSDCDVICNIDLNDIIAYHQRTDADMTIAVKTVELTAEQAKTSVLLTSDDDGRITDCIAYPMDFEGKADMNLNIIVMKTKYLQQIVLDAITHNHTSLTRDVIARNMGHHNYRVYKYDGYFACITSFTEYYKHSLELISNPEAREALFNVKDRPVYTKVRNSTPAYYSSTSNVKDSFIADGCVIEGTVENSILFRGVKVDRKATVKNSIIMQDTIIGEGAFLNCVIADKNSVITDGKMLSGAEAQPFYVPKGKII